MIRLSAIVWLVVLALLGVGLFQVKYEVQAREKELRQVRKQIEANEASIRVLEAEWSYLNDLSRLNDLARRHTELSPTTPSQVGDFRELPLRPSEPRDSEGAAPLILSESEPDSQPIVPAHDDEVIEAILAEMSEGNGEPALKPRIPATGTGAGSPLESE